MGFKSVQKMWRMWRKIYTKQQTLQPSTFALTSQAARRSPPKRADGAGDFLREDTLTLLL